MSSDAQTLAHNLAIVAAVSSWALTHRRRTCGWGQPLPYRQSPHEHVYVNLNRLARCGRDLVHPCAVGRGVIGLEQDDESVHVEPIAHSLIGASSLVRPARSPDRPGLNTPTGHLHARHVEALVKTTSARYWPGQRQR